MPRPLPVDEHKELQEEFPVEFPYFFTNTGELNGFGKIAEELLEKRRMVTDAGLA